MNFAMATLGLKEMGKFLWEGREKKFAQLAVSVSHSKVHWENAKKKSGIMKSGLDAMPLFILDNLLKKILPNGAICMSGNNQF